MISAMSSSVISPICWWRMMPLAVDDEGLGHARRAELELDLAVAGRRRSRSNGSPYAARKAARSSGAVAHGDAVDRDAAPRSAASCGASTRHGRHQLAKTLTRCGRPAAQIGAAPGRDGPASPARARNRASAGRSSSTGCRGLRRRVEPRSDHARKSANSASGSQRMQPLHAGASSGRGAGARAAGGRSATGSRRTRPSRRRARSG